MKKIIFSTLIALLLAFVGCQNEELVNENTNNGGEKVILTANIQGATDSRVVLTPDTENGDPIVKVAWNESGETFEVYGSSGACSTFIQIANTNQFEGTLPESATGEYEAYYGNPNSLVEQDGKLGQSTANDSPVLMSAEFNSSSPSITFEHVTAILKPTFKVNGTDFNNTITNINNTITKIVMGGVAKANSSNGYYLDEITIPPTSPATAMDDDIYIHLLVFPQVYIAGHKFTFTVTAGGKEYTGSLTIRKSIEAGNLYTATIELTEVLSAEYIWKSGITASESVEGNGTKVSPYRIATAKDLQWMINQVNTNGVTGKYFQLTHNLEIDSKAGSTWTPIGTAEKPFLGYFDGGGYTISGEIVTAADVKYVGFFGVVNIGTVITNLTNAADITPLFQGGCQVGGIVGVAIGYDADGSQYNSTYIIACHNTGTITYTYSGTLETLICLGGIAGHIHGGTCVLACSNTGDMVINSSISIIHGGIVGVSDTEINTVPSVVSCQTSKGTIIGENFGVITRANYTTDVNYVSDLYYIPAYTEALVWDAPDGLQVYNGLNYYIYAFNNCNYDYTDRTISCNWHWELVNGSVVLRAGKPT